MCIYGYTKRSFPNRNEHYYIIKICNTISKFLNRALENIFPYVGYLPSYLYMKTPFKSLTREPGMRSGSLFFGSVLIAFWKRGLLMY